MYRLIYKKGNYVLGKNGKPLEFTERSKAEKYQSDWNLKFTDSPNNKIEIREVK